MSIDLLFWDVDTQHDFMDEDGKLTVPEAARIVAPLARLTELAVERGIPIIASADAHPCGDPEFDEFGQHCVAGTPGQEKIGATTAPAVEVAVPERLTQQLDRLRRGEINQLVLEKQDLDVFTVELADRVLSGLDPDHICVYGVTTEYCVLKTVLGLAERGYTVTVVQDAVKAIEQKAGGRAREQMLRTGADFTDSASLIDSLSE